ncbi:MAG: MASE1 domain-containing protein, partial [Bdellovibrionia bacterium]
MKYLKITLVFGLYLSAALLGLKVEAVGGFATLVWAPTGIAVAAMLIWGGGVWPGIAAGAWAANYISGAPFLAATGIAAGNTLEALVAAFLLMRIAGFHRRIDRLIDVTAFVLFACILGPTISATVGAASLYLAGVIESARFSETWRAWWMGDALGALIVAPLILSLHEKSWRTRSLIRIASGAFLLLGAALTTMIVFGGWNLFFGLQNAPILPYMLFPFVVFAAIGFGQFGIMTMMFVVSGLAIWGTTAGHGPFTFGTLPDNLMYLHSFLSVITITGMTLAASTAERILREVISRKSETLKSAILEASLDCIISMDSNSRILEFNASAERIFGYRAQDVIGQEMSEFIIPERLREAHRNGLARYMSTGKGPVLGKRLELTAMRKDGSEFPVELSIVALRADGSPIFTGFLRDITDIKKRETERTLLLASEELAKRRLRVQFSVMGILSESKNLKDAAKRILQLIAEDLHWDVGAFFVVDEDAGLLRSAEIWNSATFDPKGFIEASRNWVFAPGEGLAGRIWAAKKPSWITNVATDGNMPRFLIASKDGLNSAFGFPIIIGEKVLGIMEFFSRDLREPDEELLQAVAASGGQIGQFMNRLTAEVEREKMLVQVQAASRSRDQFLATLSHELRTPLNVV